MQSHKRNFEFGPNFNFSSNNLFVTQFNDFSNIFPPNPSLFLLMEGPPNHFKLMNGDDFALMI